MKRVVLISGVLMAGLVGAGERLGLLDECRYDAAKLPEGGAARALLAANPDAGTAVASNAVSLLGPLNVGLEKRVTVGDGVWAIGAANWAREYVLYSAPSGGVETCDISIAGETTKFVHPAYVDLATGEYFALSAPVRTATGWTFKDVPVAKTPRALTDRTFVRPLRWNKKFWRLTTAVKDDKLFYSVGEKPELVVSLTDEDGQPVRGEDVRVSIWWYRDGESTNELAEIGADGTVRRSMALDRPGYVGARVRLMGLTQWHTPNSLRSIDLLTRTKDGKVQTVGGDIGVGVFFDPQKLVPHRALPQRPAGAVASDKAVGFNPTNDVPYAEEVDEYWDGLLAKDREIEAAGGFASGELRYVRTAENGCKIYDTWMDSLGGRSYFQVSFPPEVEKGKKFPIWGIVQASGCYPPSAWTWPWAITVAPCAHSMDYSRDKSYRKEMREKIGVYYGFSSYFYNNRGQPVHDRQNDLPNDRNESPDTCYFRDMLLRHVRAYRWMMKRPEWNGGNVAIYGGSQGGYLALATACLVPEINSVHIVCPWLCDLHGSRFHAERPVPLYALNFIDATVLAHRLKAPKLRLEQGLIDSCCPPDGTMIMMNQLPKTTAVSARYYQGKSHAVPEERIGSFMSVTVSNGVWTTKQEYVP